MIDKPLANQYLRLFRFARRGYLAKGNGFRDSADRAPLGHMRCHHRAVRRGHLGCHGVSAFLFLWLVRKVSGRDEGERLGVSILKSSEAGTHGVAPCSSDFKIDAMVLLVGVLCRVCQCLRCLRLLGRGVIFWGLFLRSSPPSERKTN